MNRQNMTEAIETRQTPRWWRAFGVVIVALIFGVVMRATLLLAAPASAPVAAALTQSVPNDDGGGDDDDDDDDDEHDDFVVTYGRVITAPAGNLGTWVISKTELISYTVNGSTQIEGSPGQGSCVEVKALASDPTTAIKIREKDSHMCGHDDDDDDGDDDDDDSTRTLYGLIESLPDDLQNGLWVVGGFTFVVSPTTELVDNGMVFTTGVTVKVDFTTSISEANVANQGEINYATRIEIKFSNTNPCRRGDDHGDDDYGDDAHGDSLNHFGGDDDHRYGFCPGRDGKAIARIDSLPVGTVIGDWMIGGVPYQTNAFTKFKPQGDVFLVGERVRVEYVVLDDQTRLATKIQEIGGGSNPNGSMYAGYVDAKPAQFVGTWTIGGEPFEAMTSTIFIERGSLFAVGAYVVVEYEITNDMRVISKILTYVPPGAGDLNSVGRLQSIGGAMAAGVDMPLQTSEEWVVDGVSYVVSEATMLVEGDSELAEGALVSVNSYLFEGQRYATMIRAQAGKAFIPMAANE